MKRCAGCGNPVRKTIRALVIKSDTPPRMGLVCRVCANCGVLVVPGSLRMLPAKPKRVSRRAATGLLRRHAADVCVTSGHMRADAATDSLMEDEDGSPLDAESDPDT